MKKEKENARKQKIYQSLEIEYGLSNMSLNEKIHKFIEEYNKIHESIDEETNKILEDLEKVQELTPIDKPTYLEFVRICSLKNNDKLHEKAITKFEQEFYDKLYNTNIRHTFLESYMNGDELKITNEDQEEFTPFENFPSKEFEDIMQNSATIRENVNLFFRKKQKQICTAVEYITDEELKAKDFKRLADFEYFKDGGKPKEDSPSKLWKIFEQFGSVYRLLDKWGFEYVNKELKDEFGLDIQLRQPNLKEHPWDVQDAQE